MEEARDISRAAGQPLCSAHVLLALFTVPNLAESLLREQAVDEDRILALIRSIDGEGPEAIRELKLRSRQTAVGLNSPQVDCLHLLLAMSRIKGSLAYDLLLRSGVSIPDLRNTAIASASANATRRRPRGPVSELGRRPSRGGYMDREAHRIEARHRPAEPQAPAYRHQDLPEPQLPPDEGGSMQAEAGEDEPPFYFLDPELFPWLTSLGRNLTLLAARGKIDPLIGRERQISEMVDIMGKRRANNPCLVGPPGVGKTAIVEGLARFLYAGDGVPPSLHERVIVELDVGALLAGTQLRGSLSEKVRGIKEEVQRADGRVVVFIDELHSVVGAGAGSDGSSGISGELKTVLARGEFPCIGATTEDEYHRYIEADPALSRRFQSVLVPEPPVEEAVQILKGVVDRYEAHHQVSFGADAVESCVRLSDRYIRDRNLPDKAFSVLDLAGSRAARQGLDAVGAEQVAKVVADITGVPEERLLLSDRERLLRMEDALGKRIIGHRRIIRQMADVIRRNYAGFSSQRPMGSFLFLGPSGVGKTETAKALAEFLFGTDEALTRLDMSEYSESHAVARLIGAPPGYVGFEDGGQLTEAVRRRPFHVVLLDEIEKAHRDVLQLLLQVLDEGRLTDGRGKVVSFTNTVVLLTSNLGAEATLAGTGNAPGQSRPIGFASSGGSSGPPSSDVEEDPAIGRALESARRALAPELWNRIEERLVFLPLSRDEVHRIARLLLNDSAKRLAQERDIQLSFEDDLIELLIDAGGFDAQLGARPMRQTIQRLVEAPLAERILSGGFRAGDAVKSFANDGRVEFSAS